MLTLQIQIWNFFNSPAIIDNSAQMKKKDKLSEDFTILDDSGRTEMHLKRLGKFASRSKFVSGNTVPEIGLTIQDQKISGHPSSPTFNIDSELVIDNYNSYINTSNSNTNMLISSLEIQTGTSAQDIMDKL